MSTQTTTTALAEPSQDRPGSQVRVQFTTQHPDISLPENTGPIVVPTNLRRYGLSTLVNHLLGTEKPTPFDFLVSGTFLRTSIDEYLTASGLSAETTVTLEYVRSIIPPLYVASYEHDDWVSSVDVLSGSSQAQAWGGTTRQPGHERILSGSYDGLLRVWNTSSQTLATSLSAADGGHSSSIKAARFMSPSRVVSSGLDRTVRIWNYAESSDDTSASLEPYLELYGHRSSVDDVAVHAPSSRILSASADHSVGFWSAKKSDAPSAPSSLLPSSNPSRSSKRRKHTQTTDTHQRGPLTLLQAHTAPVSATIFDARDATVAYSASWDHTLRTWDLPTSTAVDARTTAHALLSLAALPSLGLLAAGTAARHITLLDPRASAATVSALTLRGHANAVVSLVPDPGSGFGLVSGSHDGTCRVWDVRSSSSSSGSGGGVVGESVYTVEREQVRGKGRRVGGDGVKVFTVAWDAALGIVSAGQDRRVQVNKGQDSSTTTAGTIDK
ncbi:MAG: ribosome biogenesis protein ytm1 [Thelocarpon impressellum]|nr:MAG: ribosome biogenesis protein ytm1 [Thelocarpon impressellum]